MPTTQHLQARRLWFEAENIHAVTYFGPETAAASRKAGLKGFWMGYFAFRAAPLGAVPAAVVEAVFANFEPTMVQRAVPDAWALADPAHVVQIRATAAADTLRRTAPGIDDVAEALADELRQITEVADPMGRPLFAANRAIAATIDDPVARLWQETTALREHRGDGHVLLLASHGLSGCEAHIMQAATTGVPIELLRDNRGWTTNQWDEAVDQLDERRLLDGRVPTMEGTALIREIEDQTDVLAQQPIEHGVGKKRAEALITALKPIVLAINANEVIPFPNPMGLPTPHVD